MKHREYLTTPISVLLITNKTTARKIVQKNELQQLCFFKKLSPLPLENMDGS